MKRVFIHERDHVFPIHKQLVVKMGVVVKGRLLKDSPGKHPLLPVSYLRLLYLVGIKGE